MNEGPALWTSDDAARATRGNAQGRWRATGVSIDSRTLAPGDLFIALQGPNFDGQAFVAEALAKGAAAALVACRPEGVQADAPLLVVKDTMEALRDLGRAGRARSGARIAGITGSVGKTSIKEAMRLVLAAQAATHASSGSFNNHWGVPLSLARMRVDAAFAVFEMGMNHPGEITPLTEMVRPQVAAITTVEAVHLEHFSSLEAIADAKAEIFLGLERDGIAVLNRDNPQFDRLVRRANEAGIDRIVSFGRSSAAVVRLIGAEEDTDGSTVTADVLGKPVAFRVGIPGRHWVGNALCVLAVAAALGADVLLAAAALAELQPPKGRGARLRVRLADGTFELIDDSYNASPPSMEAAIQVLGGTRPGPAGRRIAVLGDMLELGPQAPSLHAGLAQPLLAAGIDLVFTAGAMMAHLRNALPGSMRAEHAPDSAALATAVAAALRPGDVVTVKGSAGSRMRRVVDALLALEQSAAGTPQRSAGGRGG